ncbi:hypothetical protein GRS96_02515 [Rathayibacter sp. VKM Ac-2803]|uniref:hypothetical protein n=1 Tax=Rathayibacter sp. VKM Ac-2803 TaxID=2609256 RepID=UPI00135B1EB6|nr:hypothetical protein [Rathayibacter sp. VKM Ac-2803]MWV48148.1 hypothetical protein [Rathayibacter sp. VKM Ac-2803]
MTHRDTPNRDIKIGEDWTVPNPDGVGRRTIVQGSVWTIPVVAMAVATPASAASNQPTLAFTQPSYSGVACGTISGVQVRRTTDGAAPAAGEMISVTLTDGYTFAGGSTTYSAPADANGTITLPDITVPIGGGATTFNASSGTLTDTAPVTVPRVTVAHTYTSDGGNTTYSSVPSDATTAGWTSYLAPNGDLYYGNNVIATNVTSADVQHDQATAQDFITYVSNGVAYIRSGQPLGAPIASPDVPAASTVVGWTTWLAPNGDLYYGNNVIASNVSSANVQHDATSSQDLVTYVSNGVAYTRSGQPLGTPAAYANVPAGSTVVGWTTWLAPNGDLYYGNNVIASNVSSASVQHDAATSQDFVTYVSNGVAYRRSGQPLGTPTASPSVPAGSTVVGWASYLAPNGDLYYGDNVIASDVTSADAQHSESTPADYLTYVAEACA